MLTLFPQSFRQLVSTSAVAVLSLVAVCLLQVPQLNKLIDSPKTASLASLSEETQVEKSRLNILKHLPAFGFDNLIADWTFINFLQYFGDDEAREKTGYRLSPEFFEVIIKKDPRFLQVYPFLSASTSIYSAMPERSVELMNQGLKSVSPQVPQNSYYIWRYKALDELLFLGDAKAAQNSFATAAQWASKYSDEQSQQVAAISRRTAEYLARNPQSKSAQIAAWTMVFNQAVDDTTRKLATKKIESLGGKIVKDKQGKLQIIMPKDD
jgi:hypothetical protein